MNNLKSRLLASKPEESLPLNLSVSKVKTFKDCPRKYHFCYIEKLPRKDWEHHIFGKFLHEVLEFFYKERISGSNLPLHLLMKEVFQKAFENWKDRLTQEQFIESKAILSGYLKQLNKLGGQAPTILTVEKSFYIDIDGKILLNGFIDRTQRDSDGVLHVSDYKTTKNKKYLKNDFFQLLTYAYVLMLEDPSLKKVRTSYILLRHDFETIVKEFERDEVMQVEQMFLEWSEKINSEKLFRPIPSKLCGYCDYLEFCDAGKKIMRDDMPIMGAKFGSQSW